VTNETSNPTAGSINPVCPGCAAVLSGEELENLKCADCGADLPPRLGI
jgi:exosome complex RNA-binding protein Csl4